MWGFLYYRLLLASVFPKFIVVYHTIKQAMTHEGSSFYIYNGIQTRKAVIRSVAHKYVISNLIF